MTWIDDRKRRVRESADVCGIDFVEVDAESPTRLRVFFFDDTSTFALTPAHIDIRAVDRAASPVSVGIVAVGWVVVDGANVVQVDCDQVGDFTDYVLFIDHGSVDEGFASSRFSFRVHCERDVDCRIAVEAPTCDAPVEVEVSYRERDYAGLREAILQFWRQRYPAWGDDTAADQGVMLAEVAAAIGDEFAIYQDRIALESRWDTASQRRSIDFLARMVDYAWAPAQAASGWVCVEVDTEVEIAAGTRVCRVLPGASDPVERKDVVVYEVAESFEDIPSARTFDADPAKNLLAVHIWDVDGAPVAPAGRDYVDVDGDLLEAFVGPTTTDGPHAASGWVILESTATDVARRKHIVCTLRAAARMDDAVAEEVVTRLWFVEPFDCPVDLRTIQVRANVLPLLAGESSTSYFGFRTGISDENFGGDAIERLGPNGSVVVRQGLGVGELAFSETTPHLLVESEPWDDTDFGSFRTRAFSEPWAFRRSFLYGAAATQEEPSFTVDRGHWDVVATWWAGGQKLQHRDYAASDGWTLRFGDGEFGKAPEPGDVFRLWSRTGGGPRWNAPAETLGYVLRVDVGVTELESVLAGVTRVWNPLSIDGGTSETPVERVHEDAPRQYREVVHRAVRPSDYADQVASLDVVQRASARFRWTGSWTTAFVTPDGLGSDALTDEVNDAARTRLERVRQAGRPVRVESPEYVDLDLRIHVCLERGADETWVIRRLDRVLRGTADVPGYFSPDVWTLGQSLHRDELEAAIAEVPGVRAVKRIELRRRGIFDWRPWFGLVFEVGPRELLRVSQDPLFPRRGSFEIRVDGGGR